MPSAAPVARAPHVAANKAPLPLSDGKHILQAGTAGVSLLMAPSQCLSPDTQASVRCLWSSTTDGPKSADAGGSNPLECVALPTKTISPLHLKMDKFC